MNREQKKQQKKNKEEEGIPYHEVLEHELRTSLMQFKKTYNEKNPNKEEHIDRLELVEHIFKAQGVATKASLKLEITVQGVQSIVAEKVVDFRTAGEVKQAPVWKMALYREMFKDFVGVSIMSILGFREMENVSS